MLHVFKLPRGPRLQLAGVIASAGFLVSLAMVLRGGDMARHLPDEGFHVAAFAGAGLAGLLLADGFGRDGQRGWLLSFGWFTLATAIGSGIGAMISMLIAVIGSDGLAVSVSGFVQGAVMSPALGWIAMIDGLTTSLAVLLAWGGAFALVHLLALRIRDRARVASRLAPF